MIVDGHLLLRDFAFEIGTRGPSVLFNPLPETQPILIEGRSFRPGFSLLDESAAAKIGNLRPSASIGG